MWIHGNFATYYPYPTSKSPGSGLGVQTHGREHVPLLPTYDFFLDDLWFCDMKSGYWEKKKIYGRKPQRRTDHILAVSGNLLILHGGFGDNDHFHDTWHYIIDENWWLKRSIPCISHVLTHCALMTLPPFNLIRLASNLISRMT